MMRQIFVKPIGIMTYDEMRMRTMQGISTSKTFKVKSETQI